MMLGGRSANQRGVGGIGSDVKGKGKFSKDARQGGH